MNYGWDVYEGRARYEPRAARRRAGSSRRSHVYRHAQGCSVTGGFVYRGTAVPAVRGRYFYGDYCSGTSGASERSAGGRQRSGASRSGCRS